jgi:hypothetical protein
MQDSQLYRFGNGMYFSANPAGADRFATSSTTLPYRVMVECEVSVPERCSHSVMGVESVRFRLRRKRWYPLIHKYFIGCGRNRRLRFQCDSRNPQTCDNVYETGGDRRSHLITRWNQLVSGLWFHFAFYSEWNQDNTAVGRNSETISELDLLKRSQILRVVLAMTSNQKSQTRSIRWPEESRIDSSRYFVSLSLEEVHILLDTMESFRYIIAVESAAWDC